MLGFVWLLTYTMRSEMCCMQSKCTCFANDVQIHHKIRGNNSNKFEKTETLVKYVCYNSRNTDKCRVINNYKINWDTLYHCYGVKLLTRKSKIVSLEAQVLH